MRKNLHFHEFLSTFALGTSWLDSDALTRTDPKPLKTTTIHYYKQSWSDAESDAKRLRTDALQ